MCRGDSACNILNTEFTEERLFVPSQYVVQLQASFLPCNPQHRPHDSTSVGDGNFSSLFLRVHCAILKNRLE